MIGTFFSFVALVCSSLLLLFGFFWGVIVIATIYQENRKGTQRLNSVNKLSMVIPLSLMSCGFWGIVITLKIIR